jgi:predicted TIM-barrel fold metal-dependent hydrolase
VHADPLFFQLETDAELFQQDLSVAPLLAWPPPTSDLQQITGITITNLASYADAIDKLFSMYAPLADAVKQHSAYWRAQSFDKVLDADAALVLENAMKDPKLVPPPRQKLLQDWAFHRCIRRCIEHDLPIKIHTGYVVGNNAMILENLKPAPLASLFGQDPEARFDVFHTAYPFQDQMLALAKQYSNVYVDMCWVWLMDPIASRRFLQQFLTAVPANKLFAFGGDYAYADPVYGHLRIARDGIARALSELVADGWCTRQRAITLAQRILHDNAAEFFRVDAKVAAMKQARMR